MNVLEASKERLRIIFKEFDNVYVGFSGGKDSGVLLNLCIDLIREEFHGRKLGVMHMDYECQYSMTSEFVESVLRSNQDILEVYWVCVPFKVPTCCSMNEAWWRPWDPEKSDLWARELPQGALTSCDFDFFNKNMWDYDFQVLFTKWLHEKKNAQKTCCLVGIREEESLNRWRVFHSDHRKFLYKDYTWTKGLEIGNGLYNAYPIHDWKVEDVWTYLARTGHEYNKIYDLYWMAGLSVHQMRVASPFLSENQSYLELYRAIDPNVWGKMLSRVNGVNFTGIYGGTTAMGWRSITKPSNFTWYDYMNFLLKTLPQTTRKRYEEKLKTSQKFWREVGGCLDESVIEKLNNLGIEYCIGEPSKISSKPRVRMEYLDDIDIAEFSQIPSYKRMCVCIMKNDHFCKYMGFAQNKEERALRNGALDKYSKL